MRTWLASMFLIVVSVSQVHAFEEKALKNLNILRQCAKCDLSGVDLHGQSLKKVDITKANLGGANLSDVDPTKSNLINMKMDGAILCRTKLPRGEDNSGCK